MMEQTDQKSESLRQILRLGITLYFLGLAMGILPTKESVAFLKFLVSEPTSTHNALFSLGVFSVAYFVLIGKHLRIASSALIAFTIASRVILPVDGFQMALVRDAALVASLLLTGGWFVHTEVHEDAPGRIRLTRNAPPIRKKRSRKSENPPRLSHAFAQSPDDLGRLFDQISEVQ